MDGTNGIVSGAALPLVSPMSIECWFWPIGSFSFAQIICAWDNSNAPSLFLGVNPSLVLTFSITGSPSLTYTLPATQAWYHIVGTYDGANIRLYVNAVQRASGAFSTAISTSHLIGWGESPLNTSNRLNGLLTECALYTTALSAGSVTTHYTSADAIAQPVFIAPGVVGGGGSTFIPNSEQLTAILNAVQHTFPTT